MAVETLDDSRRLASTGRPIVTVILYCVDFHIFRLFHAINCIY